MAAAVVVAGACLVRSGTGSASALEDLGYSINGIEITEKVYTSDVPGDQNGGDEGPPIDIQYFGETHTIRMELSKYDATVAAKIQPKQLGGTAGTIGTAGTLYGAGSKSFRILLTATNFTRNYLACVPRGEPISLNAGTKFTKLVLEFEAQASGGTIYNTTTS